MFLISWKLTLLVVAIGPIVLVPAILIGKRIRTLSRTSQDSLASASGRAGESLGAIQTVQAFTREAKERADFTNAVERTFDAHKKRILVRSFMTLIIFGLGMMGMIGVMWFTPKALLALKMSISSIPRAPQSRHWMMLALRLSQVKR